MTAGHSATPLPRKLGIKPHAPVLLVDPPDGFALPDDVRVHRRAAQAAYDVVLVFCPDRAALERRFVPLTARLAAVGGLWVAWPKRASQVRTDLTEDVVRDVGLAAGLVDVKVIAIDETWSGLKFVVRRRDR
jgi:hypothetical protein